MGGLTDNQAKLVWETLGSTIPLEEFQRKLRDAAAPPAAVPVGPKAEVKASNQALAAATNEYNTTRTIHQKARD